MHSAQAVPAFTTIQAVLRCSVLQPALRFWNFFFHFWNFLTGITHRHVGLPSLSRILRFIRSLCVWREGLFTAKRHCHVGGTALSSHQQMDVQVLPGLGLEAAVNVYVRVFVWMCFHFSWVNAQGVGFLTSPADAN